MRHACKIAGEAEAPHLFTTLSFYGIMEMRSGVGTGRRLRPRPRWRRSIKKDRGILNARECWDGGIGIRARLKIVRPQGHEGSSPSPSTHDSEVKAKVEQTRSCGREAARGFKPLPGHRMARVIAIFNQKGGVGKTTTAMNLSGYVAMLGKRTLLIDLDPQFNATVGLGVKHGPDETVYHALLAGKNIHKVIKRTHLSGLDLMPASQDLAGALVELVEVPEREFQLKKLLSGIQNEYDYLFIDLGPSLNLLTINGLLAADEVIAPIQCEYYSLEGLGQLLETLTLIRNNFRHPLTIRGALLTMYDKREKLSREVAREIRKRFPYRVYDVEIPRSVALAEAPSFQKPIMLYAPQSPGALAYEHLARELLASEPDAPQGERALWETAGKTDFGTYYVSEEQEELITPAPTSVPPKPLRPEEEREETPFMLHIHEE